MTTITEQIRQVEEKISDLRLKLLVEEGVLKRLKALNNSEQSSIPIRDIGPVIRQGTLIDRIRETMSERNRAMHVREITEILKTKGVTSNQKAGLSSAVACSLHRRNDLFRRVQHGTYELVRPIKIE